jgi:flagellar secretion chaperone FliS
MPPFAPPQTSAYNPAARPPGATGVELPRLDLTLMDTALEHIAGASRRMKLGENAAKHRLLHSTLQLIGELRGSLDLGAGGPMAVNLDDLCDYMARQLTCAGRQNRLAPLGEVSDLLREIRSAWVSLPPDPGSTLAAAASV